MKYYKSRTPSLRHRQIVDTNSILTTSVPFKSLLFKKASSSGRNSSGKITVRHRCAGNKKKFRNIDFFRNKLGIKGVVQTVEYDPYRTAFISLVKYLDGEWRYILTPQGLSVGDVVFSGSGSDHRVGDSLLLKDIPDGSFIHNLELSPKGGAKLVRSAGVYAVVMGKALGSVTVKLPSGEVRLFDALCMATLGQVSNPDNRNRVLGKAGASWKKGRRPTVRGSVMNACDHPHGGGEGRAPIGRSGPLSPWGKKTLGKKTRSVKKASDRVIVSRRPR